MTRPDTGQAALIAEDFAAQFAAAQATPRGADLRAICEGLAIHYGTTPEEVDRIQREHATEGPC